MNHSTPPPDDSWESDAVWKLLDEAAPMTPRPSFADDVVRMAKLEPVPQPWWKQLLTPAPIATLAAVAAAMALGFAFLTSPGSGPVPSLDGPPLAKIDTPAQEDPFAELQDFAETETLLAAADHLEDFSDQELAGLIGF